MFELICFIQYPPLIWTKCIINHYDDKILLTPCSFVIRNATGQFFIPSFRKIIGSADAEVYKIGIASVYHPIFVMLSRIAPVAEKKKKSLAVLQIIVFIFWLVIARQF